MIQPQNNSEFFNGGEKMFLKKTKEATAREYWEKMDKINRQLSDLNKLAEKYQACARQAAQK